MLRRWDVDGITALAQEQMPRSQVFLAGDRWGGAFARVQVSRTRTGLLEHASGGVAVSGEGATTADLVVAAAQALEKVADRFMVRDAVVGLADYDVGDVGLVHRPRARMPEAPLAALFGTRTVHDMGADAEELSKQFDISMVGTGGGQSLLLRRSGSDGLWAQLVAFDRAVGVDQIAAAIGLQIGGDVNAA